LRARGREGYAFVGRGGSSEVGEGDIAGYLYKGNREEQMGMEGREAREVNGRTVNRIFLTLFIYTSMKFLVNM
jgi:hypothetical protein